MARRCRVLSHALGVLDQAPNLEDAVGFFGGTLSRAISWDPCFMEPGEAECSLTFDGQSVTLEGTVTDAGCGGPLFA